MVYVSFAPSYFSEIAVGKSLIRSQKIRGMAAFVSIDYLVSRLSTEKFGLFILFADIFLIIFFKRVRTTTFYKFVTVGDADESVAMKNETLFL